MRQMIVLATRNQGKVKELQEILADFPVDIRSLADFGPLPEVVEDGATFDDNAYKKALFTAKALGLPALADDSGLVVEALNGAPGVHSARYAADAGVGAVGDAQANIARLLKEMTGVSNRRAAFVCVLSLAVPSGAALTYEGRCQGEITDKPRGKQGFGYDSVLFYPPLGKTFAELSLAEKNLISHRGIAMAQFRQEFSKVLKWLEHRLLEAKSPKPDHRAFAHNDWSKEVMSK